MCPKVGNPISDCKAAEAQHWREIQAGYDACVEPLNANLGRGPVDQATFDAIMKAKKDARTLVRREGAMKCLSVVAIIARPVVVNSEKLARRKTTVQRTASALTRQTCIK